MILQKKCEYEKAISKLDRVVNANTRMGLLINDLLELSRVGRIDMDKIYLDMNITLRNLKENLKHKLKEVQFELILETEYPTIYANESRILQIFENLIGNAFKYGKTQLGKNIIKIGSKVYDNEYWFYVKDFGQGIPKEYHKKVFGLFYRLDNTLDGTGIGLSVVRKVMQFHEGRVWIESARGRGSTFWLAFPKTPEIT